MTAQAKVQEQDVSRPRGPLAMEYARLAVPDLAATVAFLEYQVGLVREVHGEDHAYLRVGTEHHCLELERDRSLERFAVQAIGFSVEDDTVLADLRARVTAAGHAVLPLQERMKGLCVDGFAVRDPDGLTVELFTGFLEYAEPPIVELRPRELVHPFLISSHYAETVRFYTEVLGFLVSDLIEDSTAFLRCEDRYHHSLAIRRGAQADLEHLCFIMESFDHVMRRRGRAQYRGVPISSDVVNHSASHSLAFYLFDPAHGPRYELCDAHRQLTPAEHETFRPRRLKRDPRNIDVWRAAADDRTWMR